MEYINLQFYVAPVSNVSTHNFVKFALIYLCLALGFANLTRDFVEFFRAELVQDEFEFELDRDAWGNQTKQAWHLPYIN